MSLYAHTVRDLDGLGQYFSINALNDSRVAELPYCIRVLLESALRNCDGLNVTKDDVEKILDWTKTAISDTEIRFKPARVLLQDFTGVPAVVDLAAMRDAVQRLGGDPQKINPQVPVDLVVDHSVQVDSWNNDDAKKKNEEIEYNRNNQRFSFLKWGSTSFDNLLIVPPGSGIVHQVNLEYLARVIFEDSTSPAAVASGKPILYPDSVVGTDSHTTMIDGLGVVGWGVGGIEAEAVMLGQAISMLLPQVVGFKLTGELQPTVTATDLVLTITKQLRELGVVGKFVEFYGPGSESLSLADRATIANMSPEYGATMGFFPVDGQTLRYLSQTNRSASKITLCHKYLKAQSLFYDASHPTPKYTVVTELDLSTVESCVAGPKRPQDLIPIKSLSTKFREAITAPQGFAGFGLAPDAVNQTVQFSYGGASYTLKHGSVVIAAITSCTNTSNPSVMLGAGLLAKNAVQKGLKVAPYIKTSLAPGSGVVSKYFEASGLIEPLKKLGFYVVAFGCTTCIGNSGDLPPEVAQAVEGSPLVVSSVLSGNRNFEGRVHPSTAANYLMSPVLVVAYALAGTVNIDFEKEPLGHDQQGKPVYLRDVWPSREEIQEIESDVICPKIFEDCYAAIKGGNERWNALPAAKSTLYPWDPQCTYIHNPPFFASMERNLPPREDVADGRCLLFLGDSITTDHISPAGKISRDSPAAKYLVERGVSIADFNTYGARRGNDEVMARGTYANIRLNNKLAPNQGPKSVHLPTGTVASIYDVAKMYMEQGTALVVIAGKEYGSGSSRDWAAKGPLLQGVKVVIASSYERIHRSNLIGMGIVPLQFLSGQNGETLGLTGQESFNIKLRELQVGGEAEVDASGKVFKTKVRIDTEVELQYFMNGGILHYVMRNLL